LEWPVDDQTSNPSPSSAPHPIPTDWPLAVPVVVAVATATTFALLPLDRPILCSPLELATAALAAALAWTAMAIVREEERLNARGETLVPRRWRYDRRATLLGTARALGAAIEGLEGGEDAGYVLGALREGTRRGDALPEGRARLCYDIALDVLGEGGRDEALLWLGAARKEVLREMMR
jgi:hypothetical protein